MNLKLIHSNENPERGFDAFVVIGDSEEEDYFLDPEKTPYLLLSLDGERWGPGWIWHPRGNIVRPPSFGTEPPKKIKAVSGKELLSILDRNR